MASKTSARAARKTRQSVKENDPRYQAFTRALGHQIALVRRERGKELGLSQAEIAKAAEIDVSRLSTIENGKTLAATWTLYGLGRALQVPPGATFLDPVIQYLTTHDYSAPVATDGATNGTANRARPGTAELAAPAAAGVDIQATIQDALFATLADIFEAIGTARHAQQEANARGKAQGARAAAPRKRAGGRDAGR